MKRRPCQTSDNSTRTMIIVKIGTKKVNFLYDKGSQYSIMRRNDYDKLTSRPPLQPVVKQGTGVNGSKFSFDGITYLNLSFATDKGVPFVLEYEPVLISKSVTCNIFGANTENRFASCQRGLKSHKIAYVTEHSEKINLECYKESPSFGSAFIEVAKCMVIPAQNVNNIKIRVVGQINKADDQLFQIRSYNNDDRLYSKEYCTDKLTEKHTIHNNSDDHLKLRKGDIIASVDIVTKLTGGENDRRVFSHELENEKFDLLHLNEFEQNSLSRIIKEYNEKVKLTLLNKSKIPYEHELVIKANIPVSSKARVLPHSYETEVNKQIEDLLDKGVIEISDSPFASPIVPVVKRDGSIRICCDYRKLNEKNNSIVVSYTEKRDFAGFG